MVFGDFRGYNDLRGDQVKTRARTKQLDTQTTVPMTVDLQDEYQRLADELFTNRAALMRRALTEWMAQRREELTANAA